MNTYTFNWVDILWDADDGLPVSHPDHLWGATGCGPDRYDAAIESIKRQCPGAIISFWFDDDGSGLCQHLAETGRSL